MNNEIQVQQQRQQLKEHKLQKHRQSHNKTGILKLWRRKAAAYRVAWVALAALSFLVIAGCGSQTQGAIQEGKLNVVTSFYPIYEFAKEIGGEDTNVINLLPTGVEPHDWTPKSQDIMNTSKAQLFLYNGAGLEGWVPNFLQGIDKSSQVKAVEVSQGIDLIHTDEDDGHNHGATGQAGDPQSVSEAHEHADEHEHEHDAHETDEAGASSSGENAHENDGTHYVDPHTWVSPKSALIMAENIKNELIAADPEHKVEYEQRYEGLKEKLVALDVEFEQKLSSLPKHEIVVSHQAFGYLCRDYGLVQHSIMGLSPEAEPRGQDLVRLAQLVKDEGIKYIFFEELVSDRLAQTLASEAGVETMVLNPVEGLTKEQAANGDNYFTLMQNNLNNLVTALQ